MNDQKVGFILECKFASTFKKEIRVCVYNSVH